MDLLLLHGALGTQEQLAFLKHVLQNPEAVSIDLSGHGTKDLPDAGLSFDRFMRDIDEALDKHQWDQVDLLGYSMGGYAALLYASRYPDKVRSVVTWGTKLKWDRVGLDRELRMLDPGKMKEKVPQFANELARLHGADRWETLVRSTADLITGLHNDPLLTPEVFAGIDIPVLLCVGDRDGTAVPEHTLEVARGMPQASTLVLPRTPHQLNAVDLDVLLPHLRAFWRHAQERISAPSTL